MQQYQYFQTFLRIVPDYKHLKSPVQRFESVFYPEPLIPPYVYNTEFPFHQVICNCYVDSHIRYFNNMYVKRLNLYKKIGFSVIGWATPEKQQANAIYDAGNYSDTFEQDVIEADKAIVISSPVLLREKVNRFIYIVRSRQEAGVKITVITTNPDRVLDSSSDYYMELINTMTNNGINVIPREEVLEHFAVIDDEIVWHGGVNLLGSDDIWDNLIRIKSPIVAAELLELALGDDRWESWDYE
jgi:hypothetical protein